MFSNPEDAEAAFMKLLKRIGAQSDWSWPQTVRAGIKDSHWKAIPDPNQREEAFKKYCEELREQDKAKEAERQMQVRADFMKMLKNNTDIKHYTRWKTALPMIEEETIFRNAKDDTERRALFDEYIITLKQEHAEKEADQKKSALDDLTDLLHSLDLEPFTRWQTAEEKLGNTEQFHSEKFEPLNKVDVLTTFERHIRQLQREHNDRVQAERRAKHRIERRNRDAFIELLNELKTNGKLKAGTKWKDVHEHVHDDPRYVAMLGQGGSSPLDLFWDALEEEEGKFRTQRRYALEALEVSLTWSILW
jgi:pre-mRNA-processing factor 40